MWQWTVCVIPLNYEPSWLSTLQIVRHSFYYEPCPHMPALVIYGLLSLWTSASCSLLLIDIIPCGSLHALQDKKNMRLSELFLCQLIPKCTNHPAGFGGQNKGRVTKYPRSSCEALSKIMFQLTNTPLVGPLNGNFTFKSWLNKVVFTAKGDPDVTLPQGKECLLPIESWCPNKSRPVGEIGSIYIQ